MNIYKLIFKDATMKLAQILLASTFALTAATTFAATAEQPKEDKVIVSTQELPADAATDATSAQPAAEQPASASAATDAQPAQ